MSLQQVARQLNGVFAGVRRERKRERDYEEWCLLGCYAVWLL
jgi:hypothetical protein